MKKEPKAVYIIENGGYTELTYEEFRRREQICPLYADKLFLPLYGSLMEVSKEDYEEYYRQRNRQIYIDRRASRNGDVSYNALTTNEFNGEDILIAEQPDVCDTVVESNIHSNQPGAEFYITIYGSIAQSESENISANIKWGKAQATREGKVVFRYKNFLGYRKGEDGQSQIVPEEAETTALYMTVSSQATA